MVLDSEESGMPIDGREGLILFFRVGMCSFGVRLTEIIRIDEAQGERGNGPPEDNEPGKKVDLRSYFGLEHEQRGEGKILIVFGSEDESFGLVADGVEEIVPAQTAPEFGWPPHIEGEAARIFGGFYKKGERLVPAINAAAIIEAALEGSA